MSKRVRVFFTTLGALAIATVVVTLWAKGYRVNKETKTLEKTGMISVKSLPDGAKVSVNGKLTTATNTTLPGLKPGIYTLKVEKEGYTNWEKDVPVEEELVTPVEALMIPLAPELKPLTNRGVLVSALSSDREKILFTSQNSDQSGLWILPLTGFSRNTPRLLLEDSPTLTASAPTALYWSPNDKEVLLEMNPQGFYLFTPNQNGNAQPVATTSSKPSFTLWHEEDKESHQAILDKAGLRKDIEATALKPTTLWSPDGKKFLFQKQREDQIDYYVYNLKTPLSVGERLEYLTLTTPQSSKVRLSWYSDSQHLIVVEENEVSLVELDGENKTQVYTGVLAPDQVYPTPDGSRLVVLTSFNPQADPNLYTVSLR